MKIVILIVLLLCSCSLTRKRPVVPLVQYSVKVLDVYPGKVRKLKIKIPDNASKSSLICNDEVLASVTEEGFLNSLFSLDYKFLEENPGKSINCFFKSQIGNQLVNFHIFTLNPKAFNYPSRRLNVNKKHVDLSKEDLERFLIEKKKLGSIYENVITDRKLFTKNFKRPLESKVTSIYGTRRVFNNKKDSWHSGTDFRARTPIPIPSSNDGVVIFAEELFFNGNTVYVDHGLGVITMYCHLSRIDVKVGDKVNQKTILGLSGNTGRSNAPHLHWGVKVGENWVDGIQFLEEQNSKGLEVSYQQASSKK